MDAGRDGPRWRRRHAAETGRKHRYSAAGATTGLYLRFGDGKDADRATSRLDPRPMAQRVGYAGRPSRETGRSGARGLTLLALVTNDGRTVVRTDYPRPLGVAHVQRTASRLSCTTHNLHEVQPAQRATALRRPGAPARRRKGPVLGRLGQPCKHTARAGRCKHTTARAPTPPRGRYANFNPCKTDERARG